MQRVQRTISAKAAPLLSLAGVVPPIAEEVQASHELVPLKDRLRQELQLSSMPSGSQSLEALFKAGACHSEHSCHSSHMARRCTRACFQTSEHLAAKDAVGEVTTTAAFQVHRSWMTMVYTSIAKCLLFSSFKVVSHNMLRW